RQVPSARLAAHAARGADSQRHPPRLPCPPLLPLPPRPRAAAAVSACSLGSAAQCRLRAGYPYDRGLLPATHRGGAGLLDATGLPEAAGHGALLHTWVRVSTQLLCTT